MKLRKTLSIVTFVMTFALYALIRSDVWLSSLISVYIIIIISPIIGLILSFTNDGIIRIVGVLGNTVAFVWCSTIATFSLFPFLVSL